jgi:hypothetical protein
VAQFRAWLSEGDNAWDVRKITKRLRELHTELDAVEVARRWNHGDWRQFVDGLADGSVALVLTDPPCGDDAAATLRELEECLRALYPKLAENAHVLSFTRPKPEPGFRRAITIAGYELRSAVVWWKNAADPHDPVKEFARSMNGSCMR